MGNRFNKLRKQQKLTQGQFAEQVGISTSFMGHVERGTRAASLETLVAICNALNVSPDYLLYDSLERQACTSPDNANGQAVAQLRKHLQCAVEIIEQLGSE